MFTGTTVCIQAKQLCISLTIIKGNKKPFKMDDKTYQAFWNAYLRFYPQLEVARLEATYWKYKRFQKRGLEYDFKGGDKGKPTGDDVKLRAEGKDRYVFGI